MGDHYSEDHNVGMGMVPCKKGCRCNECEIDRLRQQVAALKSKLRSAEDERDRFQKVGQHYDHVLHAYAAAHCAVNNGHSDPACSASLYVARLTTQLKAATDAGVKP